MRQSSQKKWGKPSHSFFSFWSWCENIWFLCGYCVLYLCYQYDRMYEQTVMLLGTAGRLVSHMLRLMQLTRHRLYSTFSWHWREGTQLSLHVFSCVITSWQRHCHCACISVVPSKDATPFILCARLVKIRAPQAKILLCLIDLCGFLSTKYEIEVQNPKICLQNSWIKWVF